MKKSTGERNACLEYCHVEATKLALWFYSMEYSHCSYYASVNSSCVLSPPPPPWVLGISRMANSLGWRLLRCQIPRVGDEKRGQMPRPPSTLQHFSSTAHLFYFNSLSLLKVGKLTWRELSSDELISDLVWAQPSTIYRLAVHVLKKLQEKIKFGQFTS